MDFSTLKKMEETRNKGVPEDLADRKVLNTADIRESFVNDAPVVIIRKPKNEQEKDAAGKKIAGKWKRAYSKDGTFALFQDVAYIPILYKGERCLIITATKGTVRPLMLLMEDQERGQLVRGEDYDDINRWERFEASEVIDGRLTFENVQTEYADGKSYPVPVLASAD